MNDTLILFIAIVISAGIGAFIGLKFTQLKNKGDQSTLEEREHQLTTTINELKSKITDVETVRDLSLIHI